MAGLAERKSKIGIPIRSDLLTLAVHANRGNRDALYAFHYVIFRENAIAREFSNFALAGWSACNFLSELITPFGITYISRPLFIFKILTIENGIGYVYGKKQVSYSNKNLFVIVQSRL